MPQPAVVASLSLLPSPKIAANGENRFGEESVTGVKERWGALLSPCGWEGAFPLRGGGAATRVGPSAASGRGGAVRTGGRQGAAVGSGRGCGKGQRPPSLRPPKGPPAHGRGVPGLLLHVPRCRARCLARRVHGDAALRSKIKTSLHGEGARLSPLFAGCVQEVSRQLRAAALRGSAQGLCCVPELPSGLWAPSEPFQTSKTFRRCLEDQVARWLSEPLVVSLPPFGKMLAYCTEQSPSTQGRPEISASRRAPSSPSCRFQSRK